MLFTLEVSVLQEDTVLLVSCPEGLMKGFVEMTEPDGGECAGVTFTVVIAGSGLSRVFAKRRASNLLNHGSHSLFRFKFPVFPLRFIFFPEQTGEG